MARALTAAMLLILTGCSSGRNSECRWPDDPARPLNLSIDADARHLTEDVELIEELSVRFADAAPLGPGPKKQRYKIDGCYDPLMKALTARHDVSMNDIVAAQSRLGQRGMNLVVNIPVAVLFGMMTVIALRAIRRRFAADEHVAIAFATALAAVAVPAMTVGAGRLWQMISETIRVGNGHLGGQRGLRLPWVQHSTEYFFVAIAAFAMIAAVYHARANRTQTTRTH